MPDTYPLSEEELYQAALLSASIVSTARPTQTGQTIVVVNGIGVTVTADMVILARAVIQLSRAATRERAINVTAAAEGHCRLPDVHMTTDGVRNIARGFYRYRVDHPGRLSISGLLITPTVDEALQSIARILMGHVGEPDL